MGITQSICQGDVVATTKVLRAVHVGEYMGIPTSGRRVSLRITDFVRMDAEGRIVEHRACTGQLETEEEKKK